LIAPAMNTSMYLHPITQASVKKLKDIGLEILETASGVLACGETGFGKLLDPDLILQEIKNRLGPADSNPDKQALTKKNDSIPFRVLITAGGTSEPVDDVRVISNISTGATGARLADFLTDFGAEVHLLRAESAKSAGTRVAQTVFTTYHSLDKNLKYLLTNQDFDLIVHMAAVSDFAVESFEINGTEHRPGDFAKIHSSDKLTIRFKNNPKIVDQIKAASRNKKVKLVAFKLTSRASGHERDVAVENLKAHAQADYVVHNDTSEIDKVKQQHRFTIYGKNSKVPLDNIQALAAELAQNYLKERL
jgi:phosphopantothenoylcysteine decarboxylase/phosphopantothenate--cysteine ligase